MIMIIHADNCGEFCDNNTNVDLIKHINQGN